MEENNEYTRRLEDLCRAVAAMPVVLVSIANQHGIHWAETTRNQARKIIDDDLKMD